MMNWHTMGPVTSKCRENAGMHISDLISQLTATIRASSLLPGSNIIPDSKIHRISQNGKVNAEIAQLTLSKRWSPNYLLKKFKDSSPRPEFTTL